MNVTFPSNGLTLAGHLYTPAAEPLGALAAGHPAYQGASECLPCGLEDPAQRVEVLKAVVTVSAVDIAHQFRLGADGTQAPDVFAGPLDCASHVDLYDKPEFVPSAVDRLTVFFTRELVK